MKKELGESTAGNPIPALPLPACPDPTTQHTPAHTCYRHSNFFVQKLLLRLVTGTVPALVVARDYVPRSASLTTSSEGVHSIQTC